MKNEIKKTNRGLFNDDLEDRAFRNDVEAECAKDALLLLQAETQELQIQQVPNEKANKRDERLAAVGCTDCSVRAAEVVYETTTMLFCGDCHSYRADSLRAVLVLLRKETTREIKRLEVLLSIDKG